MLKEKLWMNGCVDEQMNEDMDGGVDGCKGGKSWPRSGPANQHAIKLIGGFPIQTLLNGTGHPRWLPRLRTQKGSE